ncbi:hypothetical protein [Neisseria cinerea]|nr:hypothetical protein [Neisseria cinerea]
MPSVFTFIPDLWGKFSDHENPSYHHYCCVVIPDLWGKFSDQSKP